MGRPMLPDARRDCEQCGQMLTRKRYRNSLEDRARFSTRRHCNQKCMALTMLQPTSASPQYSRRKAAKTVLTACETCGRSGARLVVHHKDENPLNNVSTNLQTLCASCHQVTHSPNYTGTPPRRKNCVLCSKPAARRGYCYTHLTRVKKHGDPLLVKRGNGYGSRLIRVTS